MKTWRRVPTGTDMLAAAIASLVPASLALSACGGSGSSAPGAVSEGEAQALEEAAEMLDERRLPEGALPPVNGNPAPDPEQTAIPEQAENE